MILKLPQNVINQIAAGEVVERPASVIKELIENSLDAQADELKIYIEEYGIKKIQVIDNGVGIEKRDFENLFIKHSTSKISTIEDLEKINTFGFRGEALSTIASVSKLKLETRNLKDDIGSEITVLYGTKEIIKPSNITSGTNILVEDLFGNIPVRRKFLKSKLTENKVNIDTINKYVLSNSNISFYINIEGNNKVYPKEELYKRISKLFKIKESDLIEINFKNFISIYGFLLNPKIFLKSKSYQFIFVNKRPVIDQTISKAIIDGLDTFMMKNQYPGYVLFIDLDPQLVDINVHPRKIEVRFQNNNLIYTQIKTAINNTITNYMRSITQAKILNLKQENKSESNLEINPQIPTITTIDQTSLTNNKSIQLKNKDLKNFTPKALEFNQFILEASKSIHKNVDIKQINNTNNNINQDYLQIDTQNITQLLNAYIITSNKKSIIIIDQHAASEKILYEKYLNLIKTQKIESKLLFIPIMIDIEQTEIKILKEKKTILNKLGFDFEEFGLNSIKVTKVPYFTRLEKFEDIFLEIVSDITQNIDTTNIDEKILNKIAASLACHSAVRFGDKLTKEEIVTLIKDLMQCNNPYSCPHGRPIILEYGIDEIEKKFRRCV